MFLLPNSKKIWPEKDREDVKDGKLVLSKVM